MIEHVDINGYSIIKQYVETAADIDLGLYTDNQVYREDNTNQQTSAYSKTYWGLRRIQIESVRGTAR